MMRYSHSNSNILTCNVAAYIYDVETMALTEKQQEKVQVCENYWVGIIVGVKELLRDEWTKLRVEVGVKESLKKKSVSSRLN